MARPSGRALKSAISDSLTSAGGYASVKVGNAADRSDEFRVHRGDAGRDQLDFEGFTPSEIDYAIARMIELGRL